MTRRCTSSSQKLTHHAAYCFQCERSVDARNAVAWAHNHARHYGHRVELQLGYSVVPIA